MTASPAPAANMAYVNYPLLLKEAPQAQASIKQLKDEFSDQLVKIKKDEADVKKLRTQFLSLGPQTNSLERASVAEKLKKARKSMHDDQQSYQTAFSLRRDQLTANLSKLVHREIESYAKIHKISVVLGSRTLFATPTADITDAILARLKTDYEAVQKQDH